MFQAYKNIALEIFDNDYVSKLTNKPYYIEEEMVVESDEFRKELDEIMDGRLGDFQQDAHEILISLLDIFHDGLKEEFNNYKLETITNIDSNDKLKRVASLKWIEYNKIEKYSIINKTLKGQMRTRIE